MLKIRREVAHSVAAELLPLEEELDAAIVRNARLQIALIEARRRARLPLDAGQRGIDLAAAAGAQLLAARTAIHEAHMDFRQVQLDMGIKTLGFGDYGDTPDSMASEDLAPWSVISAAA